MNCHNTLSHSVLVAASMVTRSRCPRVLRPLTMAVVTSDRIQLSRLGITVVVLRRCVVTETQPK